MSAVSMRDPVAIERTDQTAGHPDRIVANDRLVRILSPLARLSANVSHTWSGSLYSWHRSKFFALRGRQFLLCECVSPLNLPTWPPFRCNGNRLQPFQVYR